MNIKQCNTLAHITVRLRVVSQVVWNGLTLEYSMHCGSAFREFCGCTVFYAIEAINNFEGHENRFQITFHHHVLVCYCGREYSVYIKAAKSIDQQTERRAPLRQVSIYGR